MGAAVSLERKAIRASGISRRRADATGRHRISSPIPSGLTRRIFINPRLRLRLRLSEDFQLDRASASTSAFFNRSRTASITLSGEIVFRHSRYTVLRQVRLKQGLQGTPLLSTR